jgi:hypothetical protein
MVSRASCINVRACFLIEGWVLLHRHFFTFFIDFAFLAAIILNGRAAITRLGATPRPLHMLACPYVDLVASL